MTKREHNRRCATWMVAFYEALFEGRKVTILPVVSFGRQLRLL